MNNELKEKIEQLVSYYNYHSMNDFVNGTDDRLRGFVVDDFTNLLKELEKVV
jgi:hypothetical protein